MSRVRCLLCALFVVIVGVTSAAGLREREPVEISTAAPVAGEVVTPAAPTIAEPSAVDGLALDRAFARPASTASTCRRR